MKLIPNPASQEQVVIIRANASHLDDVFELNQGNVPAVGEVSRDWFEQMLDTEGVQFRVKLVDNHVAGFYVAMRPGLNYKSLNYLWFCNRFDDFVYLDRIVVHSQCFRQGIGRDLYTFLRNENQSWASRITCEVNVKPLNQASLDFHSRLGFQEVGQQDTERGKKRVSLLSWLLTG